MHNYREYADIGAPTSYICSVSKNRLEAALQKHQQLFIYFSNFKPHFSMLYFMLSNNTNE